MQLSIGDKVPDFVGKSHTGDPVRLHELVGKAPIALFFYPGDFTPVCTTEACGFRDLATELANTGVMILGISTDAIETHKRFADAYDLPFPLVSDPDQIIAKQYGATSALLCLLGRAKRLTFVVDLERRIVEIIQAELSARKHIDGVREALKRIRFEPRSV